MPTAARPPASATAYVEVHVTAPDAATATRLAHLLVEERLAACVQVVPAVMSVYRWQGAVETAQEHLLLAKTTAATFAAIRDRIRSEHPYDTPEVLAVPVVDIDAGYAAWADAAIGPRRDAGTPSSTEDRL
jgi:periplasmic divalent cation tolerance protein